MREQVLAVAVLIGIAGFAAAGGTICFEAESAETVAASMQTRSVADASEGACLELPQGAGNPPDVIEGDATCAFLVPKGGTYALWCRVWWLDECGNSFTMTIDDGKPFTFGQDGTYKEWHWVKAPPAFRKISLKEGRHTLRIQNREDGARLDQIVLTANRRYVPVGIEKTTKPTPGKDAAE